MIELLAPAGNLEKLKIGIQYGADAVYIAGQQFGLRSAAENFSLFELSEAVSYAHNRNKKVYVTLNAFLHDDELAPLAEFVKRLDKIKPDAVICSDLGVVSVVQQNSSLPIHISTQTSVINSWHARIWKSLGAKRIVVGRELSIKEAGEIKDKTDLEIEMFVHGAMCIAYSGRCSMSTYIAGRDSNRGGCIQNCRYRYIVHDGNSPEKTTFLLSSKDLCGINYIQEFISNGIDSIKIEGRMKSSLYIASTTRAYAQAIAEYNSIGSYRQDFWNEELLKFPHRDYTDGNLVHPAGPDSMYNEQHEKGKEYKAAGTVLEVDREKQRFAFFAKNKINLGEQIEILPFKGDTIFIPISDVKNVQEKPIEVIQPGNVCWLSWQPGIEPQNVGRIYQPGKTSDSQKLKITEIVPNEN